MERKLLKVHLVLFLLSKDCRGSVRHRESRWVNSKPSALIERSPACLGVEDVGYGSVGTPRALRKG